MKSKKIKNALLVTISLALVAAASVAITWAAVFVGDSLQTKENTLTNDDLTIDLDETWFQFKDHAGSTYASDPESSLPSDYPKTVITSKKKGEDIATAYNVGTLVPKNPKIWNEKASSNAMVALGLKYTVNFVNGKTWSDSGKETAVAGDALVFDDYSAATNAVADLDGKYVFENIAELQKSTASDPYHATGANLGTGSTLWTQDVTYPNLYYYNTSLPREATAGAANDVSTETALFDYVQIKNITMVNGLYKIQVKESPETYYYTSQLPVFKISLKGYAVDANSFADTTHAAGTAIPQTTDSKTALSTLYASSLPTIKS